MGRHEAREAGRTAAELGLMVTELRDHPGVTSRFAQGSRMKVCDPVAGANFREITLLDPASPRETGDIRAAYRPIVGINRVDA